MTPNLIILLVYIALTIVFSLAAIVLFSKDKKLAVQGKERIKEKTLLFLAVFFGSIGALVGRLIARHKTDKKYFSLVIYFSLLMQIVTAVVLIVLAV
ncbi:MAG: DUF1294 domain-containing protein [Clostridia bacterium]|nr:DUF1294 domain-containing protein [Clostridia bacterium]MBP5648492.1 DUF1294 domain-containing protein [Clostridia bacterium]